jgi:phosphoglycolate phosphatase
MTGLQAVFFDLDGTLIDSAPDLGAAVDQLRVRRGLAGLPDAAYRPVCGAGARGLLGVAFGVKPGTAEFDVLKEEFFNEYERALAVRTAMFDGVADLLRGLHMAGLKWGIVTNKSKRFTVPLAQQMGLTGTGAVAGGAAAVVSGDTTPHAKPHPEPLLEACRQAGVQPERCVYVGDDQRDIQAGRAAGMATVAALWGYIGEHSVDTWGADFLAQTPHEVLPLTLKKHATA